MATLNKIINKVRMRVLVPEQHKAVIVRDGQIDRLAGPGYISYNRLSEEIDGFIKTGPQPPVTIELFQIRSSDSYLVDIRCQIGWSFDPRRCNLNLLPHLIRTAPDIQRNIITGFGTRIIRDIVGSFTVAQLRQGLTPSEIEFQIKTKLYPNIRFAGIILFPPTVESLSLPHTLDNALRQAEEKRVLLEIEHYQKQAQAKIDAVSKRLETETAAILCGIEAEAEASAKRTLAEAEAHRQNIMTKIKVQEQASLSRIAASETEQRYKWLASEPQQVVEAVTETEKFKAIAENATTVNLVTQLPPTYGTAFIPPFMQQQPINVNGHQSNGK